MEVLANFFKGQSQEFDLDYCRSLKLFVDSSKPRIEVWFKLIDERHETHVEFTVKTWNAIVVKINAIYDALFRGVREIFLINNELKIYTGSQHQLTFLNMKGVVIHLNLRDLKRLMSFSYKVSSAYRKLNIQIIETVKYLRGFLNFILNQCNQSDSNIKEFLYNVQKHIDDLSPGFVSPLPLCLSFESDSD